MSAVSTVLLGRIYREARRHVLRTTKGAGLTNDPVTDAQVLGNQPALRRIHIEFHKRLRKAGIHVEGANQ